MEVQYQPYLKQSFLKIYSNKKVTKVKIHNPIRANKQSFYQKATLQRYFPMSKLVPTQSVDN